MPNSRSRRFGIYHQAISGFLAAVCILASIILPRAHAYAVSGTANNFYFDDFTANYYLYRAEDGTSRLRVVEELVAVFPNYDQNHGITRVIPFTNQNGHNLTMESDDTISIDVKRNGVEEEISKVEVGDGYFYVYIGDADEYVHGEQTYTLTYEFRNVITDFEQWQELYWDTNGNDWSQRFNHVTTRVYFDDDIAQNYTGEASCYVGRYGDNGQNRCIISEFQDNLEWGEHKSAGGVEFSADRLSAYENLTFDLQFGPGTFAMPPKHFDLKLVYATIGIAIGSLGMLILIILCLRQTSAKRKYYKNLFVKPEYTPPAGFTVAEMAENYINKNTTGSQKVATLLELAVNHKIEMIKTEVDAAFGRKKTQWKIRIKTDTLNKQQATVLKILAGSSAELRVNQEIVVTNHTADSSLISLANSFVTSIKASLVKKGLTIDLGYKAKNGKKPLNLPGTLVIAACIWFFVWLFTFMFVFNDSAPYRTLIGEDFLPPIIIILAIAATIIPFVVGIKNAPFVQHTEKGLDYSRYLDGLQNYMKMAETDRLQMLQSVKGVDTTHQGVVKIYEKLLPYAAIFGLEKSWLNEMSRYYEFDDVTAPTWYVGVGAFSAREFSNAMMAASSSVTSSITHSTTSNSSSSSSGFGGGGFSGGGGGGGGGGGW